jgi:hypothetical protein
MMSGVAFSREEREDRLNRAALYRRMAQSMPDEAMAERFFRLAQALQEGPSATSARTVPLSVRPTASQGPGWQALSATLRAETDRQNAADPVRAAFSHHDPLPRAGDCKAD